MIRIPMQVSGLSLRDDDTDELIGRHLSDLMWSSVDGRVLATLFVDSPGPDPVSLACDASHRIEGVIASAHVARVDDGLVGISDIASRLQVSRETVRTWVLGTRGPGDFPRQRASLGAGGNKGSLKVWAWADVNAWLRQISMDDGFEYLGDHDVAKLNAHFARVETAADVAWKRVERTPRDPAKHLELYLLGGAAVHHAASEHAGEWARRWRRLNVDADEIELLMPQATTGRVVKDEH